MRKWSLALVVVTWIGTSPAALWGEKPIPLMPPPLGGHEVVVSKKATATRYAKNTRFQKREFRVQKASFVANRTRPTRQMAARRRTRARKTRSAPVLGGFELGMVGRSNSSNADVAGFRMLFGGRFFAAIPVSQRLFLKPTLGFFYRKSGEGALSVSEFMPEAGFGAQYQVARSGKLTWLVGGMARLEARFSSTSIGVLEESSSGGDSELSPVLFRMRVGPTAGFTYRASPNLGLLVDFEMSFSLTQPVKPHAGLVMGAVFAL